VLSISTAISTAISTTVTAAEPTMRIRIAWGGGVERTWVGTVSLSEGTLSDIRPLAIEADEPGSMWIESGKLRIDQPSPRAYEGVDISLHADLDAEVTIELASRSTKSPTKTVRFKVADLVLGEHKSELDRDGNWLLVQRAPGDRLRVKTDHTVMVFGVGEPFRLDVTPHLLGLPRGTELRLTAQLRLGRGDTAIWAQESQQSWPDAQASATLIRIATPIQIDRRLPAREGVYDLVVNASRRSKFRLWQTVAERKVQLVVLARDARDRTRSSAAKPPTHVLHEIDPTSSTWWDNLAKVPNLKYIPGLPQEPLSHGASRLVRTALPAKQFRSMIELGKSATTAGVAWKAYPLPVDSPGQPHVLEVEYRRGTAQSLTISVVEPNAAGEVIPIGLDSGVHIRKDSPSDFTPVGVHRIIFWPRTEAPLVLISNSDQRRGVVYSKIRLLGPQPKLNSFRIPVSGKSYLPRAIQRRLPADGRLLAAYYDKPLIPENFCCTEALDPWSGRSLDDWGTFYEAGTRLVEYLNHVGYNGLMLSVLADGSTIYPSRLLSPTPKYDTGVFFTSGQDPAQKDVLELMFRIMDRNQLTLIPTLQFTSPLPEMEMRLRKGGPAAVGVELVNGRGETWLRTSSPRGGQAPYYNPLNPHVQAAMKHVVRELARRYGHHPAFGGLAIRLSADGFAQLPGAEWGLDDTTFAQFKEDTKTTLGDQGRDRFAIREAFVRQPKGSELWLTWRAKQLKAFYVELSREVTTMQPRAKLYLAGKNMLDRPQLRKRLAPALSSRMPIEDAFRHVGFDLSLYHDTPSLTLLRPGLATTEASAADAAVFESINGASAADRLLAATRAPGTLIFHEPYRARLASFDAKSPFGRNKTSTWTVAQRSASGADRRRRIVHAIATLDSVATFEGGWMLPLGQENSLKDLVAVYRRLPAVRFATVPGKSQPVTVRSYAIKNQTYVYLTNDSPWPVIATLNIDGPKDLRAIGLSDRTMPDPKADVDGLEWQVPLAPYDLRGAVLTAGKVQLHAPQVEVPERISADLRRRIDQLARHVNALRSPVPIGAAANPGFETTAQDGEPVADWKLTAPPGVRPRLVAENAKEGQHSLRFATDGRVASLTSRPFDVPQSGNLWVSVWLRIEEGAKQPQMRLGLEGTVSGQRYHRFAELGPDIAVKPITTLWGQYVLKLDDLPDFARGPLHVRFDLAGDVQMDNVQVFFVVSDSQRSALLKMVELGHRDLQAGRLVACAKTVESYWPKLLDSTFAPRVPRLARREIPPADRPPPAAPANNGLIDRAKDFVPKLPW